jgi:DNA modification methylase
MMEFHEVANIFPMMGDEEYNALVADIKAHGLLEPVWTYQGKIIDGRNRYKACSDAGVEPQFRAWNGNGSLVEFVVSLNLKRRHLTSSQKAMVALEVESQLAIEAKLRQGTRTDLTLSKFFDNVGTASGQAAKAVGTNQQYVLDAKKIVAQAPELKAAVLNGTLNISDAKAVARLPEAQRVDVVQKIVTGEVKNVKEATSLVKHEQREQEHKVIILPQSVQLLHGDFYVEVKNVADESIDLILTDPPYNVANEREFILEGRSNISQDFGTWDKYEHKAYLALFPIWAREWARILRLHGSGYVFSSDKYNSYLRSDLEDAGLHVKATIVWHKTNPGTQVIKTNFKSSVEYILFFTKGEGGHTFNWQGENEMHNHIELPICQGNERLVDAKGYTLHPTQKPESLLSHLLAVSSQPGDTVFDGFAGVGSVAAACMNLGRKFTGIEQDATFFEAMQRRIAS